MKTKKMITIFFIFLLLITLIIPYTSGHYFSDNETHLKNHKEFSTSTFGKLSYEPTAHNFSEIHPEVIANTTFEIWNSGCCSLVYSLIENCSWVSVSPTRGVSSGKWDHHVINVTINTTGLKFGYHQCDIIIDTSDSTGIFTVAVTVIPIPNNTPEKPILIGPDQSKSNKNIVFEATTTDPDHDLIFYQWNFNEENITEWMGPYESNDVCYIEYNWEEQGNYLVKVRAKDEHGNTTEWTQHVIQVPYNRLPFSMFQTLIKLFLRIGTIIPFIQ
jgi:hypothetical protein